MVRAWTIFAWSLNAMWQGTWPNVDPFGRPWPRGSVQSQVAGRPLANGHFACVWTVQADLDWYAKQLQLNHWMSQQP
eukprot:4029384-Amphidinium_carterae.1